MREREREREREGEREREREREREPVWRLQQEELHPSYIIEEDRRPGPRLDE